MLSCLPVAYGKAPLAQLDRASDYESEGREFESIRVHFFPTLMRFLVLDVEVDNLGKTLICNVLR